MVSHGFRLYFLPVTLLILLGPCLHAQGSLIRTYTVGDGLVMNRVRGFHQDEDGFIWMYTWDGLSRYEGYRFRNYIAGRDLPHSFVNDIFELPDGKLYLPLNDGSMAVIQNQQILPEILIPRDIINDFYKADNGKVYVATDFSGICEFNNGTLIPQKTSKAIAGIQQVIHYNDHFFFIGPYSGPSGVYDEKGNLVTSWDGPPAFFNSIYKDHLNRIFVCTMEGIKEVDPQNYALKDVKQIPLDAPWKSWNANSIIVTPDEDLWIGTPQGLIHLRGDSSWSLLTVQDGLLSSRINSLFLDRSNILWIGTDAGAASIHLQNRIDDNRNLPGVFTNFILPGPNGTGYIITGNNYLSHLDKQLDLIYSRDIGNNDNQARGLIPVNNKLLVIRQTSTDELDVPYSFHHEVAIADNSSLYLHQANKYWISGDNNLYCVSPPGPSYLIKDTTYQVTSLAQARNNMVLIGTLQDGLFLGSTSPLDDTCRIHKVQDFHLWSDDLEIRSLTTSANGDIWIGTRFSGVTRLRCNEDYTDCSKETYSIIHGLVSNWITAIIEDNHGNIWVGSAAGIDKLIPKGESYSVFSFSRVNGYYANVRHLVQHSDGSIWVGHSEGLSRIIDGNIDTINPSSTFITEVTLGRKNYPVTKADPIRLRYNENSAHFSFAAPDFINATQLLFTYRLAGSKDTTWSQPVKTNEIFYGSLTPGRYRFEVASYGWNGKRSPPAGYSFQILKPFWMQAWFVMLAFFLIVISILALYRFRVRQLQQVQGVRDKIAADLHDEIGSTLTHINILSEIGRQQSVESNSASDLFERIGEEVQSSSEALDDIIWSVKTKRDSIGDIIARMRQYATEIFEPADIDFDLVEHVEGIQSFGMEFKRDFYLVYKELLRNILRHADATVVNISIHVNRTIATIKINDNGRGFDINTSTDRSGLDNIRTRAKKWEGEVVWASTEGMGTRVAVKMIPR